MYRYKQFLFAYVVSITIPSHFKLYQKLNNIAYIITEQPQTKISEQENVAKVHFVCELQDMILTLAQVMRLWNALFLQGIRVPELRYDTYTGHVPMYGSLVLQLTLSLYYSMGGSTQTQGLMMSETLMFIGICSNFILCNGKKNTLERAFVRYIFYACWYFWT